MSRKKVTMNLRVSDEQASRVSQMCEHLDITCSDLIRVLLDELYYLRATDSVLISKKEMQKMKMLNEI